MRRQKHHQKTTKKSKVKIKRNIHGKMAGSSHCLLIVTLNAYGLNSSVQRYRLAEWTEKHDPSVCCLQEIHLTTKDTCILKVLNGWKNIVHTNKSQKRIDVAILIPDKVDNKGDEEGHY